MIGILILFVAFNLLVIIWDGIIAQFKRHCLRRANIIEYRNRRHKLKDLNRRNHFAWNQLLEFHRKRRLIEKGIYVEEKEEVDRAAGVSAAEQVNLLVERSSHLVDEE